MLDLIVKIITATIITALGMIGGQCCKWTRRYLLPITVSAYTAYKEKKSKVKALAYLFLVVILSIGYGEDSFLRKVLFGSDFLTRIVYGLLISLPFLLFNKWYAIIFLPIAFSIKAGKFKITDKYEFLWEDFIRYGTIGILVVL